MQGNYPSFEDHSPALPSGEVINMAHELAIEQAKKELTYESIYDFLIRPNALRIEQALYKIHMPPDLPPVKSTAARTQASRNSSLSAWTWSSLLYPRSEMCMQDWLHWPRK